MDAATQLALMAKAKKVFGNDQTFLSFPVTPLPFTKQQLNFWADFNVTNLQTFSLLVNQIPSGEAWLPVEQKYLWEIYDEILREGDFAISSRTPQEETAYQAARNYLRVSKADGTGEDTAVYTTYKQCKDAFFLTQQRYLAAQSTAECSTDAAVKQQWSVDEPVLRREMADCEQRWILEGYKNEVEATQEKVFQLGAQSPLQTKTEWRSRFNTDIDTVTNATDLMSVYPSSFSPSNALEDGSWQPFNLTADEVKVMLDQSPAEMRSRFAVDNIDPTLDSLIFEFSSATIQRPWWVSDSFKARFWRFADQSKVLSKGTTPAAGDCTAYVTAVVFARNLTTTKKATTPNQLTAPSEAVTAIHADFKFSVMKAVAANPDIIQVKPNFQLQAQAQKLSNINPLMAQNLQSASTFRNASVVSATTPLANQAVRNFVDATRVTAPVSRLDASITPLAEGPMHENRAFFRRLKSATFSRIALPSLSEPTQGSTPPPPPPDVDPNIYILAFICKQVSLCPNPDPTLQW